MCINAIGIEYIFIRGQGIERMMKSKGNNFRQSQRHFALEIDRF